MNRIIVFAFLVAASLNVVAQPVTDTVALRAFMDGVMQTHLRDKHVIGGTVSIVKDGKVLLAKGYGFADESKQTRVSADATLFRIGSISKMFTWISVMQLVAQGKLDLNADINTYLKDFKIPATYPEPITLKHLMTHTPGFEDLVIGLFAKDSTGMKPLKEILALQIPARVRPPGTIASYSNHGTGMAAYIVEQVSGMSFNDYVEKNILGPLGMTRTTFRQPLPHELSPLLSKGYKYSDGVYDEKPLEYVPLYPVGAASSSATDMVPFMRTLLENGKLGNTVILDSATLAMMKTPAHRHHPSVNPMRYGFIDMSRGGVEVIGHGGDTFWFHSMMALFPASNLGLFISFNTDTGGGVSSAVMEEFMDRYYPATSPQPVTFGKDYLAKFAGSYRVNRYAYHDMTTVASMLNDAKITLNDSTGLRLAAGENVRILEPIDSLTFKERNKSLIFAFRRNDKGEITHLFHGSLPVFAFEKVSGLKSADLHMFIFIASIVTAIIVLLFWPLVSWSRVGYQSHRMTKPLPYSGRFIAWTNFLVLMLFYIGFASLASEDNIVNGIIPAGLKILLWIPFINMVLTLFMLVWLFRVITIRYHRLVSRLFYTIICVVAVAAFWQLYFWNLIGPSY